MSDDDDTRTRCSPEPPIPPGTRVVFHHGKWDRHLNSIGIFSVLDPQWRTRDWYFERRGTVMDDNDPRIQRHMMGGEGWSYVWWDDPKNRRYPGINRCMLDVLKPETEIKAKPTRSANAEAEQLELNL